MQKRIEQGIRAVRDWWHGLWSVPLERKCAYGTCQHRNRAKLSAVLPADDGQLTYSFCSKRHMRRWHDENFG